MNRNAESQCSMSVNLVCLVAMFSLAGAASADRPIRAEADRPSRSPSAGKVTGPAHPLQDAVAGDGATMIFRVAPVAMHPDGMYANGGAYTDADISGQTLTVPMDPVFGVGFRSFWNLFVLDWDPNSDGPPLRAWQARVDLIGASNGVGGDLALPVVPCGVNSDCEAAFGESTWQTCSSGNCKYAWVNKVRADGFRPSLPLPDCDPPTWDASTISPLGPLFFGSNPPPPCPLPDPHTPIYGGTMALDVPADADGTYTLAFFVNETFAETEGLIPILELQAGVLVIDRSCLNDVDCDDVDACTVDICNDPFAGGFCTHDPKPGWDPQTQCCNPADGAVVDRVSEQPCQAPSCSLGDGRGTLVLTPLSEGAACTTNDPCKIDETCNAAGQCQGDESAGPACRKPRYISLAPVDWGAPTAIRVWLTSLHHPQPPYDGEAARDFTGFEGESRWVGPAADCFDSDPLGPTFKCARLQCSPHYAMWAAELAGEVLHVAGEAVVPSSRYDVEQLDVACQGAEDACGAIHAEPTVYTSRWCDFSPPYQDENDLYQSQPNVLDIHASVVKLKAAPGAVLKPRAQLEGDDLDPATAVTIVELSRVVDTVKGAGYPFDGPSPCDP